MNSSLAAVAETDFQPFTDPAAGRQRARSSEKRRVGEKCK
ncbi:hypothetical protein, partial [Klebsiella pneumoniae]